LHILGNMWFLWIFGRGVEDILGHGKYLFLYFACGIAAAFAHVLLNSNSTVPTVGASGAIAGIMGAYLIKFPRAHIVTLVFIIIFLTTVDLPAAFLLLYWFAIQFFNGVGSVGYSQASSGDVAWFAHVGGFLTGMGLILILPTKQRARALVLGCSSRLSPVRPKLKNRWTFWPSPLIRTMWSRPAEAR
jgi:membrane associated rhomboid family serine protease